VAKKISDPVKKSIPKAVTEYIDRIGAIQINFRSYQVKEFKGKYYFEKAYIKINGDGTVTAPEDYMPNEAEAAAIQKAWVEGNIPKSIPARSTKGIHLMNADSKLYLFYDKEDRIIFAQERTEPKAYIPWSFWDDGEWRRMQPDGVIPFFKPRKRNMRDWKQKIMIHEGAKAAEAAQLMKSDHPWYDEFKDYEHWGIVGGALAVNRADYKDLREQMAQDTIYVCDNDHPGRSMLQWISKKYGARLTGIFFDNRFKSGWDIADPLPDEFYNRDKLYIGPRFEHFKKPATYATEIIQPTEKGEKPTPSSGGTFRKNGTTSSPRRLSSTSIIRTAFSSRKSSTTSSRLTLRCLRPRDCSSKMTRGKALRSHTIPAALPASIPDQKADSTSTPTSLVR
jgi:hypothetical protein